MYSLNNGLIKRYFSQIIFFILFCFFSTQVSAQALQVSIVYPPQNPFTIFSNDFSFNTVVDSNKLLDTITINGVPAQLRADGMYAGALVMPASGPFTINVVATDFDGNTVNVSQNNNLVLDFLSPALTVTPTGSQTTNDDTFQFDISVFEDNAYSVLVYRNDVFLADFAGLNGLVNIPVQPGINDIKFVAKDIAGNSSAEVEATVDVDKSLPQLLSHAPDNGEIINGLSLNFTGVSTEQLSSVTVNGNSAAIQPDGVTFDQALTFTQFGPELITIVMTDDAGNTNTEIIPIDVVDQTIGNPGPAIVMGAGDQHNCIEVDGVAKCWGLNNAGQVGDGVVTLPPKT